MLEEKGINLSNNFNRLERLKLFVLGDFIKDNRSELFLMHVSDSYLLYSYVFLSNLWLNIKSPATKDEIGDLDKKINETFFVEFRLLFIQILVQSGHIISLENILISDTPSNSCQIFAIGFYQCT